MTTTSSTEYKYITIPGLHDSPLIRFICNIKTSLRCDAPPEDDYRFDWINPIKEKEDA